MLQGSKKVLSLGVQVDFLAGQVPFQALIYLAKGTGKPSSRKIINWDKEEVTLGKRNMRDACPKNKLEFEVFLQALYYRYFTK